MDINYKKLKCYIMSLCGRVAGGDKCMRDICKRLEALERNISGNENEQIIITLGDDTLIFKNDNELIRDWLGSFCDEGVVVP